MAGFYYDIGHASVYSYVPLSSVYDIPAGAYIIHDPAGLDTKHDSAVPTDTVPDGHVVAIVIYSSSIAIYPAGHDVDGVAAIAGNVAKHIKNINRFICTTLV